MFRTTAYLDWNASAPLGERARAAMVDALDAANPSSVHAGGRRARQIVEAARRDVAALVGGMPENVVLTSGATEAAATLLTPRWRVGRGALAISRLYVLASDHPCLLSGGRFDSDDVTVLPVREDGIADLDALARALERHDRSAGLPTVAMHLANNETGVIQPLDPVSRLVRAAGGLLVLDAVQAVGRIAFDLAGGLADAVIVSSHKIGGPKGVGAYVLASSLSAPDPLVRGGGQERGNRAGTENVPGIAGFGAAACQALAGLGDMQAVEALRDRIEISVRRHAPDAVIFSATAPRLPNTSFFAVPGMKAETMQIAFDLDGVAVSAGSACSSGKVGPSHVLRAMGFDAAEGGLRISIGATTTEADIARFDAALAGIVARRTEARRAA